SKSGAALLMAPNHALHRHFGLAESAAFSTPWPTAFTSLPAPSIVLQPAINARLAARIIAMNVRMVDPFVDGMKPDVDRPTYGVVARPALSRFRTRRAMPRRLANQGVGVRLRDRQCGSRCRRRRQLHGCQRASDGRGSASDSRTSR